jgi:putative ABC transport system substrate-binding protein
MRRREFLLLLGGAMTAARALSAQQKAMRVIGFLSGISPAGAAPFVAEVRRGLREAGYVEDQNLAIEYRWAEGRHDRLPALAEDLVGRNVDVILASGGDLSARAAKNATSTIPIVFAVGGDPVEEGLVSSLARPGGNLTGVSVLAVELNPKRVELLSELLPQTSLIALLVNPNSPNAERVVRDIQDAAHAKGLQLQILKASTESDIDTAFATLVQQHAGALLIAGDQFFFTQREQLIALASRYAVPVIYEQRELAEAGGLISYGTKRMAAFHEVGIYLGKILKGAKPADLPVQQPTKFELVINLKTAKAVGLTVPQSILARADEVIE